MKTKILGLLAIGSLLVSTSAGAGTVTFSGSNVGGPLFLDAWPAYLYDFSASANGQYRFDTTAATFDTVIYVYPLGFNLASPPSALAFNDDNGGVTTCGVTGWCSTAFANLLAGNSYTFLIRGFLGDAGTFSAQIEGPGIGAVPEPGTLALLGLGLAGLGLSRRRKAH